MSPEKNNSEAFTYIREKINQLLEVMGTFPLKPEELDDKTLIALDPIGIIAASFKQVLKHHQETINELEVAKNEVRTVFDAINSSVMVIDQDRCIKDFNQNAKNNFFPNKSNDDIYNQSIERACGFDTSFIDRIYLNPNISHYLIDNERHFVVNISMIGNPDSDQYLSIIHLHNITEQKKIEDELNNHRNNLKQLVHERTEDYKKARDEAEKANAAKSEFLSSMSHELRTPMNAILGFAQLFEMDRSLNDNQKQNAEEILTAGRHLLNLINEVLDLAKVESGHIDLSNERFRVMPVIKECVNLTSGIAQKRHITINVTSSQDVLMYADKTRLKQALLNLISNAIKYNREFGRVKIELVPQNDNQVHILITDTGQGLTGEQIEKLFIPFNRLDNENSNIEGTGIGLTLTRRLIELMGGQIGVKSTKGVGSTFWINLPIESEKVFEIDETTKFPVQAPIADQQKILYIEDNSSNLKLVSNILKKLKHVHLISAHTPDLGIELAKTHCPHLILLDINLPGMSGYQVLDIFKSDAAMNNIPVIAVSADAMPHDIERGKAAGFDEYLTKPLDVDKFLTAINQYLKS